MLDIVQLRKDPQAIAQRLQDRGFRFDLDTFNSLESQRKSVQTETEQLQARRNALAKQIGQLKSKGEDASAVMAESQSIPGQLKGLEEQLAGIQEALQTLLLNVPNVPHGSVPVGADENSNVETRRWSPSGRDPQPLGF